MTEGEVDGRMLSSEGKRGTKVQHGKSLVVSAGTQPKEAAKVSFAVCRNETKRNETKAPRCHHFQSF